MKRKSSKPRILLVDDEICFSTSAMLILNENEFEVMTASDVETAIERLSSETIDLVITDIMMPNGPLNCPYQKTGLVLMSSFQRGEFKTSWESADPRTPIIICSADASCGEITKDFLYPDKVKVIAKPFIIPQLIEQINNILEAKET